jgi:hypothetical protein
MKVAIVFAGLFVRCLTWEPSWSLVQGDSVIRTYHREFSISHKEETMNNECSINSYNSGESKSPFRMQDLGDATIKNNAINAHGSCGSRHLPAKCSVLILVFDADCESKFPFIV